MEGAAPMASRERVHVGTQLAIHWGPLVLDFRRPIYIYMYKSIGAAEEPGGANDTMIYLSIYLSIYFPTVGPLIYRV